VRDRFIFITGASGYVGRRVVDCMGTRKFGSVRTLVRGGDLLEPVTYADALAGCDTVIHLAAVTGKRQRAEYFRVNRDGTRVLVEACRQAGVRNFLHVSTIAVKYPGLERYPYAQAKLEAEEIVRTSGLSYLIVRPTMIFGREAPVLTNLTRLAVAPVIPMFGDGTAKMQPVYVDDVAQWIASAAESNEFHDEIVELGGPEILTLEDLLRRIRVARRGKSGPVFHLPMGIVEPAVIVAEAVFGLLMPFTAGQLMALTNDGTADVVRGGMLGVSECLRLSFDDGGIREECRTYSRYLTGLEPSEYVVTKYEEFHRSAAQPARSGFDRLLLKISARSVWMTRLAETYASRFFRGSTLRRKLVLLLGLLECAQPSAAYLDAPGSHSIAGAWIGLAMSALRYAASLAASLLLFVPLHLASASRRGR
jgi:nucleoside-diphosphate-sugar epimerase